MSIVSSPTLFANCKDFYFVIYLTRGFLKRFLLQEEEYDVPEELEDIIGWFTSHCLKNSD